MARWEPDARGRLVRAAIELYAEAGYEDTTVAEITARAGLTERTFFRYFTDKREVLFDGSDDLEQSVRAAVAAVPDRTPALETVTTAFVEAAVLFEGRRDSARRRAATIAANPSLQERELLKVERLSAAVANALRARGVPHPAAELAAGAGLTLFRVAFDRWLTGDADDLADGVRWSSDELRALLAPSVAARA